MWLGQYEPELTYQFTYKSSLKQTLWSKFSSLLILLIATSNASSRFGLSWAISSVDFMNSSFIPFNLLYNYLNWYCISINLNAFGLTFLKGGYVGSAINIQPLSTKLYYVGSKYGQWFCSLSDLFLLFQKKNTH